MPFRRHHHRSSPGGIDVNIIKPAALLLAAGALVAGSAAAASAAVPDSREGTAPDGTRVTVVTDANRDRAAPDDPALDAQIGRAHV